MSNKDSGVGWWQRQELRRCCVVAQRLLRQQVQSMLSTATSNVPKSLDPMLLSARQRKRIRDAARLAQRLLQKQVDRMTLPVNVARMATAAVTPRVSEPTSLASKQTALVSKETSLVSERASLVLLRALLVSEEASSVPEEASSVSEEASSVSDRESSVSEEASSVSDRESSVSEEASSVSERESSVSEEASSVSEEASSVPEEASSVSEEASSVSDRESSVSEEASSVSDRESSVSEEASSVSERESSVSEEAFSVREGESSVSDQQSPIPKEMPEDWALILADNGHITYTALQADANWSPPLPIQLEHIVQSHHLEIELQLRRLEAEVGVLNVADALVLARIMFANGAPITQRAYEYFRTELVGWIGYYQHHEMDTPIFHSIAHNGMHIYIVCENGFAFSCLARCVTQIETNPGSAPFTLVRQPAISDALYCYKAIYMGIGRDAEYFCKQVQLHQPKLRADRWIVVGHEVCAEHQKTYFLFLLDERSALALAYHHNNNLFICMCTVKFTSCGRVPAAKIKTESVQSACN